jgi:hypothetical protein
MGRKSKLTPAQWAEVERRVLSGETASALGREFGISETAIRNKLATKENLSEQSLKVREVAEKLAGAEMALQSLHPRQREAAVDLAEKLRNISTSLACAAELGAKTAHRLQALSNSEVAKVDDADPMASLDSLRNVGVLTKLANDSAAIALNLVAANKETVVRLNAETPKPAAIPAARLSTEALREIVAARNAG